MAFYGDYEVAALARIARMGPPPSNVDFDNFPYTPALAWMLAARSARPETPIRREAEALLDDVAKEIGTSNSEALAMLRPWTQRLCRSDRKWWCRARTQSGNSVDDKGNVRSPARVVPDLGGHLPPLDAVRAVLDARSKNKLLAPSAFLPIMQRILDERLNEDDSRSAGLTSTETTAVTTLSERLEPCLDGADTNPADRRRSARGQALQALAWVLKSMAKPDEETDLEAEVDPNWLEAIAATYENHTIATLAPPKFSTKSEPTRPDVLPLELTNAGYVTRDPHGPVRIYVPDPAKGGLLHQQGARSSL